MIGKKINQLATELAPTTTDLTIIGDPVTGVSKKITLEQLGAIFGGAVSFYTNLASFPATGVIDIIYCAKDTKKLYLWSGSAYVEVFPSQSLLDTYQLRSEKGVSNGYASLDVNGKVPIGQLPNSIMEYKGTWNAATNTPTLANGTGDTGDVYICNAAGTVNFGAGPITFAVGDYIVYSGSIWQRSSGAVGTVTSVAVSRSGDALAITGSPITTSGTINIGFAGTGAQYIKGDGTLATFPSIISQAQNLVTEVYNRTGATLTKGTIVYINGGQGNLPTVTKALATGDSTSAQTYGVVQTDITNMNNGYVVAAGRLTDLDTQAYTEGTQLYLSATTAGTWTSTKQYAPNHLVYVGIVVRAHPTQGVVEVKIQNGYEMDELHNVAAQSPDNNDILQYKTATSLWTKVAGTTTNIAEGTNLYYTDARSRAALSFTAGSGAYNSTTGVITIPTNTNQLTNGAAFITLASLSAGAGISYNNTTGVIASTITQYTDALARAAISLTTTGTSGAATYNNTTGVLNIPQYQTALTNPVTGTGTNNYIAKFTTTGSTIGNSIIHESASGNIGIGNTNDTYKLDVTGKGRFGSDSVNGDVIIQSNETPLIIRGRSPYSAAGLALTWDITPNIGLIVAPSLGFNTNATLGSNVGTRALTIASTGAATFSSSVTASTFTSNVTSGIFLNNGSGGTNATQIRINNTGGDARMGIESSTGGTIQIGTSAYSAVFGNQANAPTEFTTNGTVRMTILGSGNVGIGTTNASTGKVVISQTGGTQLHLISGDSFGTTDVLLRLTSSNDYRGRGIWMDNSGTTGAWYAGVPYNGGCYSIGYDATQPEITANSKFLITTSGAATFSSTVTLVNDLTINASLTPLIFLNTTSTGKASGIITQESGTSRWAFGSSFGSGDGTFNIYNYGAAARYLTIATTGAATFNSSDANGWYGGFSNSGTNFAYMGATAQFANSGGSSTDFGIRSANALAFYTSGGNERMRITSGGAVEMTGTIKTASPSSGSAHPWKLGSYAAGGTGTATGVIYIEVNGQIYSIPALLGTP